MRPAARNVPCSNSPCPIEPRLELSLPKETGVDSLSFATFATPTGVPFLPMYAWVGLWTSGFLLTAACTNLAGTARNTLLTSSLHVCPVASARGTQSQGGHHATLAREGLIRYCTRFTEEVFNSFLGSTYIWAATNSLYGQLRVAALATAAGAAGAGLASGSALLSLVLAGLTLGLCQASSDLSTSRYFTERARSLVADFGPACSVALVSMFSASRVVRLLADVPRLGLPTGTITLGRPLLVPLFALPLKYRLLAALPAVFLAILFFLDQNITVRTVNSPVNKLLPRPTYHLDLAVLALLTAATSLCGLPWMCAATVESINHVRSMTVYKKPAQTEDLVSPAELDERELADLRMMFDSLDEGKKGSISSDKLVSLLRSRSLLEGELLTTAEAARQAAGVLQRFDQSGDGKLQFPEFVSLCVASAKGEQVMPNPNLENDDEDDAGEISVVETRLSGFLVHAMVLGTLSCVSSLRVVPIAVVNGVFLYLGRKVMQGNQFLQRLRALAVPLPLDLDTKSPAERSILVLGRDAALTFTGLQLACLATLWALKLTPGLGMVFPAAIGALMFMRAQLLPRVFTRRQLGVIDTPIWNIRRTEEEAAASLATAKNATGIQNQEL